MQLKTAGPAIWRNHSEAESWASAGSETVVAVRTKQTRLWSFFLIVAICFVYSNVGIAARLPREVTETGHSNLKPTIPRASQELANLSQYGALPLSFERNEGQSDSSVQFVSRGAGYSLFLTESEAVMAFEQADDIPPALKKMRAAKRKLFQSRKYYRGSQRFRKSRKTSVVRIAIDGANPNAVVEGNDEQPGKSNYFVGNDPTKWRTGIPTFGRVKYSNVYPGVDLVYYGKEQQLEFDFVVRPEADPKSIAFRIKSAGKSQVESNGDLAIETGSGAFRLRRPKLYQMENGAKKLVAGRFEARADGSIGFAIGPYDHRRTLTIDPTLAYSTYLGGNGVDELFGATVDASGNAYVVGQTTSTNFPTASAYSTVSDSNGIAFVSKLNPTGTALLYSTYLGGSGGESGNAIALDPNGNVYVTGYTLSTDFPVVNGYQTTLASPSGNAFVSRIDTTQTGTASLVYSTYLGGGGNSSNLYGDVGYGIAADSYGNAFVVGQTTSDASVAPFPTTSSAYQTSLASSAGNAFLSVLDTTQSGTASLFYSTYLGGGSSSEGDYGLAVVTNGEGDAFLTGVTTSVSPAPFPTTANGYQTSISQPYGAAFVTEISVDAYGSSSLSYSSYLGGSGDSADASGDAGMGIALDQTGFVYVTGNTTSSDFPVTSGAFQTTNPPNDRSFVSKFNPSRSGAQSLVYSTYLGGSGGDEGRGIAVDANGNAYVGGATSSPDFPVTTGALQNALNSSFSDAFLSEINSSGTGLVFSTYLGGSCTNGDVGNAVAVGADNNPYLAGNTCSTDFPTYPTSGLQNSLAGSQNGFVSKITLPTQTPTISMLSAATGKANDVLTITGSNFGLVEGSNTVTFGGAVASVNSWSSTSIVVLIPDSASPGLDQLVVSTPTVSSNSVGFTVNPSVALLYPSIGQAGASVSISGGNFGSAGSVTFNGLTASTSTWSSTLIVAVVPAGATSGSVIVTSNSTSSAGVPFAIAPAALISAISRNSGNVGTTVAISGSNFGSSQYAAAGSVVINGAAASISGWNDSSISVQVPATASPGLGSLVVNLDGNPSNSFAFTVAPSLSPCGTGSPGEPLFLSGSDLGSSQGGGSVSLGGTSASILNWSPIGLSVAVPTSLSAGVVNVSVIAGGITTNTESCIIVPNLTSLSPAAAQVSTPVTISGYGFGTTGTITFNGLTAAPQSWTNTAITVQVPNGASSGPLVVATAGVQTGPVNFMVLPAPSPLTSIAVQPTTANLTVGETRPLTALDNNQNSITSASWTVDNPSLASVSTDTPPALTALAAGTVTLTATYSGLTATTTWNISAVPLSLGTVAWSLPGDGQTIQQIVRATPVPASIPDLFSVEGDPASSTPGVVRGISVAGGVAWSSPIPSAATGNVLADPTGGVILTTNAGVVKLDAISGQQNWLYPAQGLSAGSTTNGTLVDALVQNPDGTAYLGVAQINNNQETSYIVSAVDATSGATKFAINLPQGYQNIYFSPVETYAVSVPAQTGPFTVMPDGSTVFEQSVLNDQIFQDYNTAFTSGCTTTVNEATNVTLVTVQPDGSSTQQTLDATTYNETDIGPGCPYHEAGYLPGQVIPDGQGGLLATWTKSSRLPSSTAYMVTHISGGTSTSYSVPYDLVPLYRGSSAPGTLMALGENGSVYATANFGTFGYPMTIFAFDENSGAVAWSYTVPPSSISQPGDGIFIVAAKNDGGLVAKSTLSGLDTILDFDASGALTNDPLSGSGLNYIYGNLWVDPPTGQPATGLIGNSIPFADTPLPEPALPPVAPIPLNVYQITGTTVNSHDTIASQVQKAINTWHTLLPGLSLNWSNNVPNQAVACDPTTLPPGRTCANTPEADLTNFDNPSTCAPSTGWAVLTTRWPNSPSPTNRQISVIFTNTLVADPPMFGYDVLESVPYYDFDLCGPANGSLGRSSGVGNDIVMGNQAFNLVLAHSIGHVFQLNDLSNSFEGVAGNLMCHDASVCPIETHGIYLTNAQLSLVSRGIKLWSPTPN